MVEALVKWQAPPPATSKKPPLVIEKTYKYKKVLICVYLVQQLTWVYTKIGDFMTKSDIICLFFRNFPETGVSVNMAEGCSSHTLKQTNRLAMEAKHNPTCLSWTQHDSQ